MRSDLAPPTKRTHTAYMVAHREDAVRRALVGAPVSIRRLAEEAGVSEGLLRHIRDGTRSASPATVTALAEALERLSEGHAAAAGLLRNSLQRGRDA